AGARGDAFSHKSYINPGRNKESHHLSTHGKHHVPSANRALGAKRAAPQRHTVLHRVHGAPAIPPPRPYLYGSDERPG
uniref:Uncharacterized protein n=1 Tax=Aegilops tauschii subsp. strangulata TaxID=200361 RepID=A0A452ZAH1_AEGTS